jgi:DNA-binding FrmR family transcriptional regulator
MQAACRPMPDSLQSPRDDALVKNVAYHPCAANKDSNATNGHLQLALDTSSREISGRMAHKYRKQHKYYTGLWYTVGMAHTTKDKERLLVRIRRIRGQVDAIERALETEQECAGILQLMAACRGALNGLMAEIMEGHVRFHVLSPDKRPNSPQAQAAEELIDVIRAYLK